ncbi:unnamed protein product, partial [Didymodactylos carnosus]
SRARSEDRFRSSTVSLCESTPSYAAPTASSKLKANSMNEQATAASNASSSSTISHHVRRAPSVVSLQIINDSSSRSSTTKALASYSQSSLDVCKKSRSTQNLSQLLTTSSTTTTTIVTACSSSSATNVREETTTIKTKPLTLKQIKMQSQQQSRRLKVKRPPNLPKPSTSSPPNPPLQLSSTSSSSASSPTKNSENLQKENQAVSPRFFPSAAPVPLRELNDQQHQPSTSTNRFSSLDIPKWAKDCLYRTIVLGLSPLVIKDSCSSSSATEDTMTNDSPPVILTPSQIPRSSSICSIESTDSLETTSEVPLYQTIFNDDQNQNDGGSFVRRSMSIPDYRHLQNQNEHQYRTRFSLPTTTVKFDRINDKDDNYSSQKEDDDDPSDTDSYNYIDDDRLRNIVDDLHNRLNQLEQLYATICKSNTSRDKMLKNYIEQIFTDLHTRITHQQQSSSTIETTTSKC